MSDAAISERLADMAKSGVALQRRPAAATWDTLAAVFDCFADEDSDERRDLTAELPGATGFSEPVVREGLRLGLADWNGDRFRELIARELGPSDREVHGFATTAVFLAGSIPMPTMLSLAAPLALRSPVLAKLAARDPVTGPHFIRAVCSRDPELGSCVDFSRFARDDRERVAALLRADCVVASGSDETIAAIAAQLRGPRRFVPYGHRLSVAVIAGDALRGDRIQTAAQRLALDIALWDQLGCLSPIVAYVVDPGTAAADRFAEELAAAMAAIEGRLPRGEVSLAAKNAIAHERASAEMRAAGGARVAVHAPSATSWSVVREDSTALREAPLHRFVRILPAGDAAELLDAMSPLGPHLSAVGVAGVDPERSPLAEAFAQLGATRVCPLGRMQCPPIAWRHDGRFVIEPLARFTDFESEA
jgi:hypothetical protein